MNIKNYPAVCDELFKKMEQDKYNQVTLEKYRWLLAHFKNYCEKRKIKEITLREAAEFVKECFGFDIYRPKLPLQSALRYPILTFFEFSENGFYAKAHQHPNSVNFPRSFDQVYQEYATHVESCKFCGCTRSRRLYIFARYAAFLGMNGIERMQDATMQEAYGFIESLSSYAPKTLRGYKAAFKFILNWLHDNGHSIFSGQQLLPSVQCEDRSRLLSYYSADEISVILNSIDRSTGYGKFEYSVLCIFSYLGMRASDVASLRFSSIDWRQGHISLTQFKTGQPLFLPLLDEVKYPLLDYIKNARPGSDDTEHIFIRMRAPYTRYPSGNALYSVVSRCIKRSGINTNGRHFGPHALRHSLASNLLAKHVPVSGISDILGHASVLTTEIYLTVDETHLKDLALEVPGL